MAQLSTPITPIYTIGYGDRTVEAFIAVLQHYQIAYVVDVRTAPYSRFKPDFSQPQLIDALKNVGIRYLFLGDQLGGRPSDPSCYSNGRVDYERVAATDPYKQGIERILTAFKQQQCVVLMCSEGRPEQCHRSKLIGETLSELAIPLLHIDEADEVQSHAAILYRLTDGQLSLFGDHAFQSRKRYGPRQKIDHDLDGIKRDEEWEE